MGKWGEAGRDVPLNVAVDSESTQRALPDLKSLTDTYGFDAFMVNPPPTVTSEPEGLKHVLKSYAIQLERHERSTEIWDRQSRNSLYSIRTFLTEFDTKCGHINRAAAKRENQSDGRVQETVEEKTTRQLVHIGSIEFEDLYYLLGYKTRYLYHDLQTRFASEFLTLDHTLHHRGANSYGELPCTVRDMRNLLRAIWFHLLHPKIIEGIETAIHARKYRHLQANRLLPANYYEMSREEQDAFNKCVKKGSDLKDAPLSKMFEHLEDISAMSPTEILNKLWARRNGPRATNPQDQQRRQKTYKEVRARSSTVLLQTKGDSCNSNETNSAEGSPRGNGMARESNIDQELSTQRTEQGKKRFSHHGSFKQELLEPKQFDPIELLRKERSPQNVKGASNGHQYRQSLQSTYGSQFKLSVTPRDGRHIKSNQELSPNRYSYPCHNEDRPTVHLHRVPTPLGCSPSAVPTVSKSVAALKKMKEDDPYTPLVYDMRDNWPLIDHERRDDIQAAMPSEYPPPLFHPLLRRSLSPSRGLRKTEHFARSKNDTTTIVLRPQSAGTLSPTRANAEPPDTTRRKDPRPMLLDPPQASNLSRLRENLRQKETEATKHPVAYPAVYHPSPARSVSPVRVSDKHLSSHVSPAMPTGMEYSPGPSDDCSVRRYFRPPPSDQTSSSVAQNSQNNRHCLSQVTSTPKVQALPPRTSSKHTTSPYRNSDLGPTDAEDIERWIPSVQTVYSRQPDSSTPSRQHIHSEQDVNKTLSSAAKMSTSRLSGNLYPISPFETRTPFNGDPEGVPPSTASPHPPRLPPKSEVQLQQAENMREGMRLMQRKIDSLEREKSQLQEILQQQHLNLAHENSNLQERLHNQNRSPSPTKNTTPAKASAKPSTKTPSKTSAKPPTTPASGAGGILRKLGRLGSRSRSKSPRKSIA